MFKFDFKVSGTDTDSENGFAPKETKDNDEKQGTSPVLEWHEAEEVLPTAESMENLDMYEMHADSVQIGDIALKCIITGFLLRDSAANMAGKDIQEAEANHSDLIPGVYEGGAKIWECTYELLKYFAGLSEGQSMWKGKRVLDLGCGSGLLGLYAYKCGAKVTFQDYNKDVLEHVTIPSFLLNRELTLKDETGKDEKPASFEKDIKFYAGDWQKFSKLTKGDKYDVIVTSETIYNPCNQSKLLETFHEKLTTDGVIYVAAKVYYFGVGGGLRQFEELIAKDKRFEAEVVWSTNDGLGREIQRLHRTKT